MADVYDIIGAELAAAELEVAKAIGKRFLLNHRELGNTTLYGTVIELELGKEQVNRGKRVETGGLKIRIPVQTGFAVMTSNQRSITVDDKITFPYDSTRYFWVKEIKLEANGYIAVVIAGERKTSRFGPSS